MYQQEFTRSGEALFKIRGKYLKTLVILSVAIAYFNGALGPFTSDFANQMWFLVSLAVAWSGAIVCFYTSGYAALSTSGVSMVAAIGIGSVEWGPVAVEQSGMGSVTKRNRSHLSPTPF